MSHLVRSYLIINRVTRDKVIVINYYLNTLIALKKYDKELIITDKLSDLYFKERYLFKVNINNIIS